MDERGDAVMAKGLWRAAVLTLAMVGLQGCGEEAAAVDTGPQAPAGIAVTGAKLMLPAVKGNPAAVYFDVVNSGTDNRVIRAASVEGAASTMLHTSDAGSMQEATQVMVEPGKTVKFEPGGLHVMAMKLADTVTPGSKTNVTLTFVGGDKVTVPAEVHAAGDAR
jgi:copper(I)-binding protein